MVDRVIYVAPDLSAPSGGVRMLYRHVELLNGAGYEAAIWHCDEHIQLDWFEHDVPIQRGPTIQLDETDTLVLPEGFVLPQIDPAPGCRKIIFNQNHYYAFSFVKAADYPRWEPRPAMWVVSHTSERVMNRVRDHLSLTSVHNVPCAIDTDLFRPGPQRERKVVWMPRKRPREAALIHALIAAHYGHREDLILRPIDGLTESETAAELGSASVFVALSRDEGFGLPVAEALAAGCAVVGYPAGGGEELFEAPGTYAIGDSDVLAVADQVIASLDAEPTRRERLEYRAWVEQRYSRAQQWKALQHALTEARKTPATAGTAIHLWPELVARSRQ